MGFWGRIARLECMFIKEVLKRACGQILEIIRNHTELLQAWGIYVGYRTFLRERNCSNYRQGHCSHLNGKERVGVGTH